MKKYRRSSDQVISLEECNLSFLGNSSFGPPWGRIKFQKPETRSCTSFCTFKGLSIDFSSKICIHINLGITETILRG